MMVQIAPSILSADFGRLADEVRLLSEAGADAIHVDIMDGHFVPNMTMGPMAVSAIKKATHLPMYVHLMIENPERFIEKYVAAGASLIHVHVEACVHLHRVLQQIRSAGAKVGVAINPATPLHSLEHVLDLVDQALVMTVNPGFGGQSFLPSMLPKIKTLAAIQSQRNLPFLIEVDGGIALENIAAVKEAGAQIVVSGSFIFSSRNYALSIQSLREAAMTQLSSLT